MVQKPRFGLEKTDIIWDEYINKYVILFSQRETNFAGRLIKTQEGYGILNPFQGGEYDPKKGFIRKMVYENTKIRLDGIVAVEPTTEKSLKASCKFLNKQEKDRQEHEKDVKEQFQDKILKRKNSKPKNQIT